MEAAIWAGRALVGLSGGDGTGGLVVFLPEPPRYFLEVAAVGTVLLLAWWRRSA